MENIQCVSFPVLLSMLKFFLALLHKNNQKLQRRGESDKKNFEVLEL